MLNEPYSLKPFNNDAYFSLHGGRGILQMNLALDFHGIVMVF